MLYTVKAETLKTFIKNQFNVSLVLSNDFVEKSCKPDGFVNIIFKNNDNSKCYWIRFNEMDFYFSYFDTYENSEGELSEIKDISKLWVHHILQNQGEEFVNNYSSIKNSRNYKLEIAAEEFLKSKALGKNVIDSKTKQLALSLKLQVKAREDELDNIVTEYKNSLLNTKF